MYLVDFFKNLFKKNNIGTIIWMILNIVLICGAFGLTAAGLYDATDNEILESVLIGLGAYIISIAIALSPVGEIIMRWQNGCRKIRDSAVLERIQPIFEEVYKKAKEKNPELPDNIKLYMSDDRSPNAFALGRHTVCITRGLLDLTDNEIKGILGHEFGHLAHKDTDTLLAITIGNLIVSIIFVVWRFIFNFIARFVNFSIGLASRTIAPIIAGFITRVFIDFLLVMAMKLWTKLGVLICMASSRANEYLADKYSFELGFGDNLCNALRKLSNLSVSADGIWAALSSSHPPMDERISRLNELLREGVY